MALAGLILLLYFCTWVPQQQKMQRLQRVDCFVNQAWIQAVPACANHNDKKRSQSQSQSQCTTLYVMVKVSATIGLQDLEGLFEIQVYDPQTNASALLLDDYPVGHIVTCYHDASVGSTCPALCGPNAPKDYTLDGATASLVGLLSVALLMVFSIFGVLACWWHDKCLNGEPFHERCRCQ